MRDSSHLRQVGAPDPELKTSPIFERETDESPSHDLELEEGVCYFNNMRYPLGQYVRSGEDILCCTNRGVWVRVGEEYPA